MTKLLIATCNTHKFRELRATLREHFPAVEYLSLRSFSEYLPPQESGDTFQANATLKALHAARAFHLLTLADDSGLIVPALGGEPGVRSARYAGVDATDADNRTLLLERMASFTDLRRHAYFACGLALASQGELLAYEEGRAEGILLQSERGGGGFGYDPLFLKHDYSQTFAELSEGTKNRISHRARALELMMPYLEQAL